MLNSVEAVRELFTMGGAVLWAIAGMTIALWALMVERYLYLRRDVPLLVQGIASAWEARPDRRSWRAQRIRELYLADLAYHARRTLPLIRTVTATLPLLGLLGTVNGMIYTFRVMSVFGADTARGMANGISEALVTTLAGLIAALPGLYCSASLGRRSEAAIQQLAHRLRVE